MIIKFNETLSVYLLLSLSYVTSSSHSFFVNPVLYKCVFLLFSPIKSVILKFIFLIIGQDRTGQNRRGPVRTGQDRTGQDRRGEERTGQDRTVQDRTEQDRTGQDRTGQDRTGQDRT